jgi:hypothetical protein
MRTHPTRRPHLGMGPAHNKPKLKTGQTKMCTHRARKGVPVLAVHERDDAAGRVRRAAVVVRRLREAADVAAQEAWRCASQRRLNERAEMNVLRAIAWGGGCERGG